MRRNIIVLGERALSGDYGRILAAGEVHLESGSARVIRAAGEARLKKCRVGKVRSAGELDAQDSELINVKCAGGALLKGLCSGDAWSVSGYLKADQLQVRLMHCGAFNHTQLGGQDTFRWEGSIQGETLEIEMPIGLACELDYRHIILTAAAQFEHELACETCHALAGIRAPGINADQIVLVNGPEVRLDYLEGSHIQIVHQFDADRLFQGIAKQRRYQSASGGRDLAQVKSIEGDWVQLAYTRAETVAGAQVVIGPMCVIDRVSYSDSIQIDDKAMVGEVIRL